MAAPKTCGVCSWLRAFVPDPAERAALLAKTHGDGQ